MQCPNYEGHIDPEELFEIHDGVMECPTRDETIRHVVDEGSYKGAAQQKLEIVDYE